MLSLDWATIPHVFRSLRRSLRIGSNWADFGQREHRRYHPAVVSET